MSISKKVKKSQMLCGLTATASMLIYSSLSTAGIIAPAYVPMWNEGALAVVDTKTMTMVGEPIKIGTNPEGVAITLDGLFVYVSNTEDHTVSVIDVLEHKVIGEPIEVAALPRSLLMSRDGESVYVINRWSSNISIIDVENNEITAPRIQVSYTPENMVLSQTGDFGYVGYYHDIPGVVGGINIIDFTLETPIVIEDIVLEGSVWDVALSPDEQYLYATLDVGADDMGFVIGIDLADPHDFDKHISIPVGIKPVGIAIAGGYGYVANSYALETNNRPTGTNVTVFDLETHEVVTTIEGFGAGVWNLSASNDEDFVVVTSRTSGVVSMIDVHTNTLLGTSFNLGDEIHSFGPFLGPERNNTTLDSLIADVRSNAGREGITQPGVYATISNLLNYAKQELNVDGSLTGTGCTFLGDAKIFFENPDIERWVIDVEHLNGLYGCS